MRVPLFFSNSEMPFHSAVYPTPLGFLHLQHESECVVSLKIFPEILLTSVPTALTDDTALQVLEYIDGKRKDFSVPFKLLGTPFQNSVWDCIRHVPYGTTASYSDLAKTLGRPSAVRAVASACGQNPLWILVPCHRIIGADGKLHGYAGGLDLKQKLIGLERHFPE